MSVKFLVAVVAVFAVLGSMVGCGGNSTASPTSTRSPVGVWSGVLVSRLDSSRLTVTLTIAAAGQGFSATCSQSGPSGTITNAPVSNFGVFSGTFPANDIGLRGVCIAFIFEVVYDPVADRLIDVVWYGGDYIGGTLTRQ
jgi:hypothetical protein